jgi:hypothetical protein
MSEAPPEYETCRSCGAEVRAGAVCGACPPPAPETPAAGAPEEVVEGAKFTLALRLGGALVYILVCAACIYCSVPLFEAGDWWFGLMGLGLACIALIGVKQALFPKEWIQE